MPKLLMSPIELSSNEDGYSIVAVSGLTELLNRAVLNHVSSRLGCTFSDLSEAAAVIEKDHFDEFKNKPSRILPKTLAAEVSDFLYSSSFINKNAHEFVTDEEFIGYENIYWRIVRANQPTDVGPVHADRWFWDLSNASLPDAYTRVKVWVPLLQDDSDPSLMILPGSHKIEYVYGHRVDTTGRIKPTFMDASVADRMTVAPVKKGQAIIFNDNLLHGGRVTTHLRISVECTLAVKSGI